MTGRITMTETQRTRRGHDFLGQYFDDLATKAYEVAAAKRDKAAPALSRPERPVTSVAGRSCVSWP